MGETGEPDRAVTVDSLLDDTEQAVLRAEFKRAVSLLSRLRNEFGAPDSEPAAVRYDALEAILAARAGNWPKAARRCPEPFDWTETGLIHVLAVFALRELAQDGRHTDTDAAAVAIVLWAYLLDEDDPGDFLGLLTERRGGAPVPDDLWDKALARLRGRVADLLRALDDRAGRDVLSAWHTAWRAECDLGVVRLGDVPADAGPHALISLEDAAWHLVDHDRGGVLLAAYTARHPDPDTWSTGAPEHRPCAKPLARALVTRATGSAQRREWSEALADFTTAVRLGHTLDSDERAAVLRAGHDVGRGVHRYEYLPLVRIAGLERAHALLPEDADLAAELTTVLVRQGSEVALSDPQKSQSCFARALAVTPGHPAALEGLAEHQRADLESSDELLRRAEALPGLVASRAQDDAVETAFQALLDLAELLEASASPSDVIALFLRDLMPTGVSARFDQIVEAAYLNRARARERAGDLGGARRDRACAERIGSGLPAQAPLFGPAPRRSRPADPGQDTLF